MAVKHSSYHSGHSGPSGSEGVHNTALHFTLLSVRRLVGWLVGCTTVGLTRECSSEIFLSIPPPGPAPSLAEQWPPRLSPEQLRAGADRLGRYIERLRVWRGSRSAEGSSPLPQNVESKDRLSTALHRTVWAFPIINHPVVHQS